MAEAYSPALAGLSNILVMSQKLFNVFSVMLS